MKNRPNKPKTKKPHLYEEVTSAPSKPLTTKYQEKKRMVRIWAVDTRVKDSSASRIKGALINH